MNNFKICVTSTCDLPKYYIEENKLGVFHLTCNLEEEAYGRKKDLDIGYFYQKMREGSMPTTSQVNPTEAREQLFHYLKETDKLLILAFSSGLSGSYGSLYLAAQELMEENPTCEIVVVDSKCASLGEGLLVHKAVALRQKGLGMDAVVTWLEENIQHMVHLFTVDDLNHLHRGGRVSKMTALVGTMIQIKPILHVDEDGCLTVIDKVRGRKKSLQTLVDCMEAKMGGFRSQNDIVFISHGDDREDAQAVADLIKSRFGIQNFLIHSIGPVIGSHAGPGTIAVFFMGEER